MPKAAGDANRDRGRERDLVGQYLDEIGRTPLLTKEQEGTLARAIEAGRAARDELDAGRATTPARRAELRRALRAGDRARQEFVQANLRLVVSIAKRYQNRGLPLLDLVQEGNLGLIHAVEKFDWRKGFKFSTYATWWVRQAIQRGIGNSGRMVRLPAHVFEETSTVLRIASDLEGRLGRAPTIAELALESNRSETRVAEILSNDAEVVSLAKPVGDDSQTELGELLRDDGAPDVAEVAMRTLLPGAIARLMQVLDARERLIVALRYGLDGGEPRSCAEIGQHLGLTRERIRQIEARALSKLRHPSNEREASDLLAS
jgi:RNA polymerase sigma factor (sigma-70 family)